MAVDYFIKFDGIKGESADAKHKDEIDVESWSWGETNTRAPAGAAAAAAGKVSMQDFNFVMKLNKASPGLMKACATGQHIKTATLSAAARRARTSRSTSRSSSTTSSSARTRRADPDTASVVPSDQVSFNFAKIEVEYKQQKPDGTVGAPVQFKYDLKANKAVLASGVTERVEPVRAVAPPEAARSAARGEPGGGSRARAAAAGRRLRARHDPGAARDRRRAPRALARAAVLPATPGRLGRARGAPAAVPPRRPGHARARLDELVGDGAPGPLAGAGLLVEDGDDRPRCGAPRARTTSS